MDGAENRSQNPGSGEPPIDFHTSSPIQHLEPSLSDVALLRADLPTPVSKRPPPRKTWKVSVIASVVIHGLVLGVVGTWMALQPEPEPELVCLTQCSFVEPDFAEEIGEDAEDVEMLEPIEIEETTLDEPVLPEEVPDEVSLPDLEPAEDLDLDTPALAVTSRMFERPTKEAPPAPVEPPPTAVRVATPASVQPTNVTPTARPQKERGATKLTAVHIPNTARYYPREARQRGIQGTVIVRITVDANGTIADVRVDRSSGSRMLDDAAVRLMWDARFRPPGARVTKKAPVNFILR